MTSKYPVNCRTEGEFIMNWKISVAVALLLSVAIAGNAIAVTRHDVKTEILTRYRVTTLDFLGSVNEVGTVLIVQKTGLTADKEMRLFKPNVVGSRQLIEAGGGRLPLGKNLDGNLKVGDRLLLYGVSTGDEYVELAVFTVKSFVLPGSGRKGPAPLQASTRFSYPGGLAAVTANQVIEDIGEWFRAEDELKSKAGTDDKVKILVREKEKQEAIIQGAAKTIRLGQSEEDVAAILGAPLTRVLLENKKVFVYKDLKIIFVGGKVVDAE